METNVTGFENLKNLFTAPTKLYENIKEAPKCKFPILVLSLLVLIYGTISLLMVVSTPEFIAQQVLEVTGNPTAAELMIETSGASGTGNTAFSAVMQIFIAIIGLLITSGFILLVSKLFGGQANFMQIFTMSCYNNIAYYLIAIISAILMVLLKTSKDILSISTILMPDGNIFDPVYMSLSCVTLYAIYLFVLNVIGIKVISSFETYVKSIIISIIIFIMPIIFVAGSIMLSLYAFSML